MRKKLFVFTSLCILTFMLVACGSSNDSTPTGDVTNVNTNVEANTNTTPEPEQVAVEQEIEQTVGEYIATQNKAPKYYLINPIYQCLDEIDDFGKQQLLENRVAIVYFGEERLPCPNDKVLIVPTFFDETIEQKTLDEVIKTINSYYIEEIINTPYKLEVISSKYSDPKPPKVLTSLKVGGTLESCINITSYYQVITTLENTKDDNFKIDTFEISHAVPFIVYDIDSEGNIYNASNKDETNVIYPKVLLGKANSIMIVKMKDVETYDIILRVSKEGLNNCNIYDVPFYKIIATNLTKKEVGRIVLPGGVLNPDYNYLINYKWTPDEEAIGKTLFEYLLTNNKHPKYFIYNHYYEEYEELTAGNKFLLAEDPMIYVYFGNSETPQKNEKIFVVETYFEGDSVKILYLEDAMDIIKNGKIISIEIADNLDFIND